MTLAGPVATLVALAAVLAAPGTAAATRTPAGASPSGPTVVAPLTGFGGYHVPGRVQEVGAQWVVPAVAPGSHMGTASTWIGAQSTAGAPFVQVGTTETAPPGGPATYELFWSDPAVGFHAQSLGVTAAGDTVVADLRRTPTGWTLRITDTTTGKGATRALAYGATGTVDQAEWFQEDPAPATITAEDLPYPSLAPVRFSALRLNGTTPTLRLADGLTLMTSDGGDFVPAVTGPGSFTLVPPTGYARTFLLDAGALDRVLSRFDAALAVWPRLTTSARALLGRQVLAGYRHLDARLAAHAWPATTSPAVHWLLARDRVVEWALHRWLLAGAALPSPAFAAFERASAPPAADAVRASLGLPPA